MRKLLSVLTITTSLAAGVMTAHCQAGQNYLKSGLGWMKSSLPDTTRFEFHKSKIRFDGCKHREYRLSMVQQINEQFTFEAGITHARGRLNWGIYRQAVRATRFSVEPRVQLNHSVSFGAGLEYQTAPEFRSNFGQPINLPSSQRFMLNSRFAGDDPRDYFELELSSERWRANETSGTWIERGVADNKINFSYTASF